MSKSLNEMSNEELWHGIYDCPDSEIWETRMALKQKLVNYIRDKFTESWLKNQGDPARVVSLLERINPNALMIGFCRRFATYKRAHLLFTDLDRLSKIVNDPERPVLFFFSGKAHPADGAGQGLIKRIYEISQRPEFLGKIIFLEDYDFQLARRLVSGVDIWMNTPTRPLEASGTSGEKAEMNGVVKRFQAQLVAVGVFDLGHEKQIRVGQRELAYVNLPEGDDGLFEEKAGAARRDHGQDEQNGCAFPEHGFLLCESGRAVNRQPGARVNGAGAGAAWVLVFANG